MKTASIYLFLAAMLLSSCKDLKETFIPCPNVERVEPDLAPGGETIVLTGSGFGFSDPSFYNVKIGGEAVPANNIISIEDGDSNDLMEILIPDGHPSGPVTVVFVAEKGFGDDCMVDMTSDPPFFFYKPSVAETPIEKIGSGVPGYAQGAGTDAQFEYPTGIAVDNAGNVYVADGGNHVIRIIRTDTKPFETNILAGIPDSVGWDNDDRGAEYTTFNTPADLAIDHSTKTLYATDRANCCVRAVYLENDFSFPAAGVSSFSGQQPPICDEMLPGPSVDGIDARYLEPEGIAVGEAEGKVYVADSGDKAIKEVERDPPFKTAVLLDELLHSTEFSDPRGVAVNSIGELYMTNFKFPGGGIWKINGMGKPELIPVEDSEAFMVPSDLAFYDDSTLFVADFNKRAVWLFNIAKKKLDVLPLPGVELIGPKGIAYDKKHRRLCIADTDGSAIYLVDIR